MLRAKVVVTLKGGVSDPQGFAVREALASMRYGAVKDVRVGKYFEIALDGVSREEAKKQLDDMSHKLLSNPVIEDYRFEIEES